MIQEPPKTVIRSYTIAYTDCNTKPLVSCSGTCLSHQLIDHGCSSDVHQSTPRLSSKRIVLILLRLSARCRQVRGVSYYSCSSEDAFARTRERQNLPEAFHGNMATLLYWSDSILGNFTVATIFPDKGTKKKFPALFLPLFFQVACSLRSLATHFPINVCFQKSGLEYWNGLNCCKKCFS